MISAFSSAYLRFPTLVLVLLVFLLPCKARAQQSDNEDGTYTNPVIWADFPDNDVIRVGDTYYMVSTSMYIFPGVPILQSKDLVNWEYASNAVDRFKQHPSYDLNGGNRYGKGQWASSIRYHKGKFQILFLTLDEGGFLYTAEKAEGPWEMHKLPKAFYDAGMFFDDNGKNYVVHGYSKILLTEVDDKLAPISKDSLIYNIGQRPGLEGSHMYKINGYYYLYATYGGGDGYQTCLRSKNIYGPYEEKIVLKDDMNLTGMGVHQGALVQTQTGEWWSIIFQDRIGVGRVPTLQPVTWIDGWPIVGKNGRAVVTHKKPNVGKNWPVKVLPTSDEFTSQTLGLQWGWNHNPDDSKWSLTEREGSLRLKTATVTNNITSARNTLTQRIFGPYSTAVAAFEVSNMKLGDIIGLGIIQIPHAFIAIKKGVKEKQIIMVNGDKIIDSIPLGNHSKIYFKSHADCTKNEANFFYSFDNTNFQALGNTLHMKFDLKMFTGNKFALFNYATKVTGGFVDVDWFRMETRKGAPNAFIASSKIQAEMYDEIYLARTTRSADNPFEDQDITNTVDGAWLKFNNINFQKRYKYINVRLSAGQKSSGTIDVYLDGNLKNPYCTIQVQPGANEQYITLQKPIKAITGKHQLTFKFSGTNTSTAKINWFSFSDQPL